MPSTSKKGAQISKPKLKVQEGKWQKLSNYPSKHNLVILSVSEGSKGVNIQRLNF